MLAQSPPTCSCTCRHTEDDVWDSKLSFIMEASRLFTRCSEHFRQIQTLYMNADIVKAKEMFNHAVRCTKETSLLVHCFWISRFTSHLRLFHVTSLSYIQRSRCPCKHKSSHCHIKFISLWYFRVGLFISLCWALVVFGNCCAMTLISPRALSGVGHDDKLSASFLCSGSQIWAPVGRPTNLCKGKIMWI